MRRTLSLCLIALVPLAVSPAVARDLWGVDGVILFDDETPVLSRTVRLNLETRLMPVVPVQAEPDLIEPEFARAELIEFAPTEITPDFSEPEPVEIATNEIASDLIELEPIGEIIVSQPRQVAGDGQVITAPQIPGYTPLPVEPVDPPAELDFALRGGAGDDLKPYTDDSDNVDFTESETIELASLTDPETTMPPAEEERSPPPQFSSVAYPGNYSGVGTAEGMLLELSLQGESVFGFFTDSSGQDFRIDGQLTDSEGRAQAVVVADQAPIGYFDLQLSNLGLSALFIPLAEDMTPRADEARQYEFLRSLSDAARNAIAAERDRRQGTQRSYEPRAQGDFSAPPQTTPEDHDGLREAFPGDE